MKKLDPYAQLELLKDVTERMEVLHEAQVQQLKLWPFVLFDNIEKFELGWDIPNKQIYYKFNFVDKDKPPTDMLVKLNLLDSYVKQMLGEEWIIDVKVAKKRFFKSYGRRPEEKFRRNTETSG